MKPTNPRYLTHPWLDGWYSATMEDFQKRRNDWQMTEPKDVANWVWFVGDYYTEEQARDYIRRIT